MFVVFMMLSHQDLSSDGSSLFLVIYCVHVLVNGNHTTAKIHPGKANAARRYIQHAPQSDFNAVDRTIFMQWFNGEEISAPMPPPVPITPVAAPAPVQTSGFQAINAPSAMLQGHIRPREQSPPSVASSNRNKRPRITENDRPPCLRCKILKKKVRITKLLMQCC